MPGTLFCIISAVKYSKTGSIHKPVVAMGSPVHHVSDTSLQFTRRLPLPHSLCASTFKIVLHVGQASAERALDVQMERNSADHQ
jgi:hypothetical protein